VRSRTLAEKPNLYHRGRSAALRASTEEHKVSKGKRFSVLLAETKVPRFARDDSREGGDVKRFVALIHETDSFIVEQRQGQRMVSACDAAAS
jgi:hypothetical protein